MKSINLFTLLCMTSLLLLTSCSESTSSKTKPEDIYTITGYYEGFINVEAVHKVDQSKNVTYPPIKETLLIKPIPGNNKEFIVVISNFEWQDTNPTNIEFAIEGRIDTKNKTAEILADKDFVDHEVIPNSTMVLTGTINDTKIVLNGKFTTLEGAEFNYNVSFEGDKSNKVYETYKFSFENWTTVSSPLLKGSYQIPEMESGVVWNSSDFEVQSFIDRGRATKHTVIPDNRAIHGRRSASVRTINILGANELPSTPTVYSGILYSGHYDNQASTPHERIRLGSLFKTQPLSIKGYYAYRSGNIYYECPDTNKPSQVVAKEGVKDSFGVYLFLYEVASQSETLSLADVFTSDKVVGKAEYIGNAENERLEQFEAKFNWKEGYVYDANKMYKIALFALSSSNALQYSGSPESQLLIDNLEIPTRD